MWLNDLKKAIILEEIDTINHLLDTIPSFTTLEEMEEASYLLLNAKNLLEKERSKTLLSLTQLKNNIDFLKATEKTQPSTLNIKL